MNAKTLYPALFEKKYQDPIDFVNEVANNEKHPFWGSGGAAREFAREILTKDAKWKWLGERLDDFAIITETNMRKKLKKWIFRAMLGRGSLAKNLCNTKGASKWLMDRYVAELKNLFDPRYKDNLDAKKTRIVPFLEDYHSIKYSYLCKRDKIKVN